MSDPDKHPPRLTHTENVLCRRFLRVDPGQIEGHPPVAILVGEAPGPNTRSDCALFPWPPRSAGGRLMEISGMDPTVYLRQFQRVNLLGEFPGTRWPREEAESAARAILAAAVLARWPIVMCGTRVAAAFGMDVHPPYEWRWVRRVHDDKRPEWGTEVLAHAYGSNVPAVRIPHPSGRSLVFNDPEERAAARALLVKAAQLRN